MAKPPPPSDAARRRHRARILASLIEVCGQLELLKVSPEARRACREVAALLGRARDRAARGGRK